MTFWNRVPNSQPVERSASPKMDAAAHGNHTPLVWGPVELDASEATGHFLAIGAPGSGKTIILRLLMQSVVPQIEFGSDARVLAFDAKQDTLAIFMGMRPKVPVVTTNPFDAHGAAWDLCQDVREPQVAVELAFTLCPEISESQPFFTDSARHLLYGTLIRLMTMGEVWSFSDLVRIMRSPRRLKALLKGSPLTIDLVEQYLKDKRLAANIGSTIATKLLPFEPIAAAWDHANEKVSLEAWAKGESILILGNSETSRTAIQTINRCMFKRAVDICLHQSESFTRRTWILADELAECGNLPGMVSALKRGRSKGMCIALGFQSVSGLRDPKLYGPHFSDEILGLVANRFVGRLECPVTAEYVSKLFGDVEVEAVSTSRTSAPQGSNYTESRQRTNRASVLPGELMSVEPCDRHNGLTGYYIVRALGAFREQLEGDELFEHDLWPVYPHSVERACRAVQAQFLNPTSPLLERLERGGINTTRPRGTRDSSHSHNLDDLTLGEEWQP